MHVFLKTTEANSSYSAYGFTKLLQLTALTMNVVLKNTVVNSIFHKTTVAKSNDRACVSQNLLHLTALTKNLFAKLPLLLTAKKNASASQFTEVNSTESDNACVSHSYCS